MRNVGPKPRALGLHVPDEKPARAVIERFIKDITLPRVPLSKASNAGAISGVLEQRARPGDGSVIKLEPAKLPAGGRIDQFRQKQQNHEVVTFYKVRDRSLFARVSDATKAR